MLALINGVILSGEGLCEHNKNSSNLLPDSVVIEGNHIVEVTHSSLLNLKDAQVIDVKGAYISPGFIDLQLNGCGGVLFNDDISLETIKHMHQTNLKYGCTSFLPTLITASFEDIEKALKITTKAYQELPYQILGIHIEGPFISKIKKGIHDEKYIRSLSQQEVDLICQSAQHLPIVLTLAPEVNDEVLIEKLLQANVKVSLGHSNGTYNDAEKSFKLGVNHITHLYNAMTPINHREPGMAIATLNHPDVYAGVVVDGYHVDFNLLKLTKKIKPKHMYIVTDAAPPAGCPTMKEFEFGGNKLFVKNGQALNEKGVLGGSIVTMIESVKNVVNGMQLDVEEAVNMASLYPATFMGVENKIGAIKPNFIANLTVFDKNFKILHTISAGKLLNVE